MPVIPTPGSTILVPVSDGENTRRWYAEVRVLYTEQGFVYAESGSTTIVVPLPTRIHDGLPVSVPDPSA